ncbi:hypothetical protein SAMN05421846_10683 [Chryseobacterium taeanense]|uniref:DUF5808 domain-containing protein n=1 Tax=Chryseobacterium taeanense TaxID=311334 RepID=A0A1G8JHQ7_9FLAO|nr:DUF5808 domain-containing protein [Chryseobacterium taeanense]SDI30758.1 hypothetical protein SAMN05421846_10683 [Chryseobacterium taeanense]
MKNRDQNSFWKLGIFYYNKKDKRLFPPKRTGLGWTVNFANPFSVTLFILILIAIILITKRFSTK